VLNEEILLPRLIQSLLAQSNGNWNLLIVDNSSSDSTMSIAKYWEEQDPRIKAIQLDEKRDTVYASWKTALDICFEITDCEYLQIAPGDDFLFNHDYVEIALQKLSAGDLNGLVPNCKYENREVALEKIRYESLFKDWNYVHLIFGIYKKSILRNATTKLNKLEGLNHTFDWWLSYFLIGCAPSYSPETVFCREPNRSQDCTENTFKLRPILDHPALKPLKRIFPMRHRIRNYIKSTKTNYRHYILIKGTFGIKNRSRLISAFLLKFLNLLFFN
jgi:glycosyltransferase involved in cell wall biosynthesis